MDLVEGLEWFAEDRRFQYMHSGDCERTLRDCERTLREAAKEIERLRLYESLILAGWPESAPAIKELLGTTDKVERVQAKQDIHGPIWAELIRAGLKLESGGVAKKAT